MLWIKRARTLLLVRFGITKTNENTKHTALENVFAAHRQNIAALDAKGHAELKAQSSIVCMSLNGGKSYLRLLTTANSSFSERSCRLIQKIPN